MTRDLALSLLRSGTNGDEILQILESLDSGSADEFAADASAADAIEF